MKEPHDPMKPELIGDGPEARTVHPSPLPKPAKPPDADAVGDDAAEELAENMDAGDIRELEKSAEKEMPRVEKKKPEP